MDLKYLTADLIFTATGDLIPNGVVVVEPDGRVHDVLNADEAALQGISEENCESHEGMICPGFVNTHCHLELSHMRGIMPRKTGLPAFIAKVVTQRDADADVIRQAMYDADQEMQKEGIVAVGDVSNLDVSFEVKSESPIYYHTFVELLGIQPDAADRIMEGGKALHRKLSDLGLAGSVNPHAPYTVSPALLKKIGNYAYETDAVLTLHNQECVPENQMFETGNGEMMEVLMQLGIDMSSFKPTGFTSMPSTLVHMPNCVPLLLVHNSVSTEKDIRWALDYHSQLTWCLCPKANLYIEDRLPDITMLRKHDLRLVIGTDGLTSNDRLSVLDEMQTIHSHFPEVTFPEMLSWSTINGARFLGISNRFGSIEKGKAPGLNLISGLDVQNVKLKPGVSLQTLRP